MGKFQDKCTPSMSCRVFHVLQIGFKQTGFQFLVIKWFHIELLDFNFAVCIGRLCNCHIGIDCYGNQICILVLHPCNLPKLTKPILAHSITNMKPSLCVLFTVDQYKAVLLHICRICVNNASFSVLKQRLQKSLILASVFYYLHKI